MPEETGQNREHRKIEESWELELVLGEGGFGLRWKLYKVKSKKERNVKFKNEILNRSVHTVPSS